MARRRNHESPLSLFAFQDIITAVTGIMVLLTLILALELAQREPASPTAQTRAVAAEIAATLEDTTAQVERLQTALAQQTDAVQSVARLTPAAAEREEADLAREMTTLEQDLARLAAALRKKQAEGEQLREQQQLQGPQREVARRLQAEADAVEQELAELKKSGRIIYRQKTGSGKRAWLVDVRGNALITAPADAQHEQIVFGAASERLNVAALLKWASNRRQSSQEYFVLLVRPSGIEAYKDLDERLLKAGFDVGIDLIGATQEVLPPAK